MDREVAIELLKQEKRAHAQVVSMADMIGIGKEHTDEGRATIEALDLAIEALMLRDKYVKALERMIEGAKEINKFLDEAAEKSDEKLQLSGETSTCKLKKDHDFLTREGEKVSKEQKSKLDCISRSWMVNALQEVNGESDMPDFWHEGMNDAIEEVKNAPSVTPTEQTIKEIMDFIGGMNMVGEITSEAYAKISDFVDDGTPTERTGEWKKEVNEKLGKCLRVVYVCSACGCAVGCEHFLRRSYCPNCGAKMKGGKE